MKHGGAPLRWLCLAALAVGVILWPWACGHDVPPTRPPPPDTTAPVVRVLYPTPDGGLYDRDSNGLLDLDVAWSDSSGHVDPGSARVWCVAACPPDAPPDTNLVTGWRVVRRDSTGLALEETVPLLLRGGESAATLRVTVADTAGNVAAPASVTVFLPPGAYHQSINLRGHPTCQPERGVNLALSPDGRKGFAPYHMCVAVFDPDGIEPTRYIAPVPNVGWASDVEVDTATGLAYVAGGGTPTTGFTVLDTRTEQVVGQHAVGLGIASVAVDGDRIYAGEACTDGRIYVLDKRTFAEVGRIEVRAVSPDATCPNSFTFAFSRDHRTGWVGVVRIGVFRFDATRFAVTDSGALDNHGVHRDILLAKDRWLYVARMQYGLQEWDTQTSRWRIADPYPTLFKELALSPDGRALVVSEYAGTGLPGDPMRYAPRLYDVPTATLRLAYPTRLGRITDAVVWHPDGKRFYVMAEFEVEVYLVRPR